ncbi:hypothetical protein D3C72_1988190 [compost metagenome]
MRTVLGHAIHVLRRHAQADELLRDFAGDGRAGHVEGADLAQRRHVAVAYRLQDVHRMGGYAHHVGRARFQDPVERMLAGAQVGHHHLQPGHQHLLHGDRRNVVAHRAERQQRGIRRVAPVLDKRTAIRQQRVVAVHDTLGQPGGA